MSGTRADFGLMARTLALAQASGALEICVCVTGMHLSPTFGATVGEVQASGLRIAASIPVALEEGSGAQMARATAHTLLGLVDAFEKERPHLVVVLGDRGEMLAGAYAALHLNIPVAHVHGGERSGTVDEPVRHAISKLAHYHFVATAGSRERLLRMGERAERIFVTGAPGLDGLREAASRDREALCAQQGFDARKPVALAVFHPVLQEAAQAGTQAEALAEALLAAGLQIVWLTPNSDAGSAKVRAALLGYASAPQMRQFTHLPRSEFASWMAAADVMAGNSSAGIIEAATFGLAVVNVGSRQDGRERSANVIDAAPARAEIARALGQALARGKEHCENVYGDGRAAQRIADLLCSVRLDVLDKTNAY